MDTTIVGALIGAAAVLLAAFIPVLLRRPGAESARCDRRPPGLPAELEQAVRQDARVRRLLGHANWRDAAEAAIAYWCRAVPCPIASWQKSSAWQQVQWVHAELTLRAAPGELGSR